MLPPVRIPKYQRGPTMPHNLRLNRVLWKDFTAWARARGWTAAEAIRWMMERVVVDPRASALDDVWEAMRRKSLADTTPEPAKSKRKRRQ